MKKELLIISGLLLSSSAFSAKITRAEYVDTWKETAVQQMMDHNIPASITLAQGILESGSGNSTLAQEGNNHFGIKCHGWTGKKMYMDDDAKGECFRVYKNAGESYQDHSEFLTKYDRYAFLFDYEVTDYKSWAKGLKKAGYATSSTYPEKLIKIIEELNLDQYDQGMTLEAPQLLVDNASLSNKHSVMLHSNKVKYVTVKEGDTFYKLSKEFSLTLKQLYRYNDFNSEKDVLEVGDIVYIQPKRRANIFKRNRTTLAEDMTVAEVSQKFALNAKTIMRLNGFTSLDDIIEKGEKITLR
ncbi:MAG: glucosaminidase domain-containing protein [Crocinitomicaceae bacterium]